MAEKLIESLEESDSLPLSAQWKEEIRKAIRDNPLIAKRKARLEIEKMILGTRPVEVNHRDPKKLRACLGGKA